MAHMVKGRQNNKAQSMPICLNHRDRLLTSIVDKNDRLMFQSQKQTRQHSTDWYAT